MTIKRKILNPKNVKFFHDSETTSCHLNFAGKTFYGQALCSSEDKEYQSEIVGSQIAHKRAAICAMKHMVNKAYNEYSALYTIYNNSGETDANSTFSRTVYKYANRYARYRRYLQELRFELKAYIAGLDKVMAYKQAKGD